MSATSRARAQDGVQAGANVAEWPIRLQSVANLREHWAVKAERVKGERTAALMLARATLRKPELPCVVTITRIAPRILDSDNLVSCAKAVRDSIAYFLGVDDRDPLVVWKYAQERGKPKTYAVRVAVEEVRT